MQTYPYASLELIAATQQSLGEPIGSQEVTLWKQLCFSAAQTKGLTVSAALGGVPIGSDTVTLMKQFLVIITAN